MVDFGVEVKIDITPVEQALGDKLGDYLDRMKDIAQRECPVDTGRMRRSIEVHQEGLEASVSANTEYAAYTEYKLGWLSKARDNIGEEIGKLWASSN